MKLYGNKKLCRHDETDGEPGNKKILRHKGLRITAVVMIMAILASLVIIPAWTYSGNTEKQEVVYVNLKNDGSVDGIYVVNSFDLNKDSQIIDYGDYTSLRNLTSDDKIKFDNQTVTINTMAGKLYYEGKLDSNVIPWTFDIHYYLDGKEYTANEIAGKSGHLKITMSIRQNPECNSAFFEHYTLQASLTLDTKSCDNIVADGATQASVGSKKQLTYTILPNTEKDFEITANVTDFKMDGIAINGVTMNMDANVNLDNNKDVQDQITQLQDGTAKLDDGAGDVESGAKDVMNGTSQVKNGVSELQGYILDLKNGAVKMQTGVSVLNNGLSTLSSNSAKINDGAYQTFKGLTQNAQQQINTVLTTNCQNTITLTPETYSKVLTDLLSTISSGAYKQAQDAAEAQVRPAVEAAVKEQVTIAVTQNIRMEYVEPAVKAQADMVYQAAAASTIKEKLITSGMTEQQAGAYLQTTEGQKQIQAVAAAMTEEQKAAAIEAAVDTQMKTDAVQQKISDAVSEQMNSNTVKQTIEAKVAEQIANNTVKEQINTAVTNALGKSDSYQSLVSVKKQLDSYNAFYQGLLSYTSGVDQAAQGAYALAEGASTLADGATKLSNASVTLCDGAVKLYNGTVELHDGTVTLKDGTLEFKDKTADMDTQLKDKIKSAIENVFGGEFKPVSFVSDKNSNVDSVQFVIKTPGVAAQKQEAAMVKETTSMNLWDKLLNLFGLYND